ncbi:GlcG/HbpS family heme-binding protein [Rufibacter latericius]|uniref:Heme-binding protein n=1 Tax=Rufibacter latericius TaxID=2487040 RepID=A0A3M9MEV0_9BACT|nr:heme-binding protein [Rufibacter latericius]RNI23725.1 heme-binding protein [Rufibacter latericius]
MKNIAVLLLLLIPSLLLAQVAASKKNTSSAKQASETSLDRKEFTVAAHQLTLAAALQMHRQAVTQAGSLQKEIAFAVVDASGQTILLLKGDRVGPHNTEAARRKAFTALSTKTATLLLGRNAKTNPDTQNLAHLPELLLLGGGIPLWYQGQVIGAVGVAGGGGPEQDDLIAKAATLKEAGITTH